MFLGENHDSAATQAGHQALLRELHRLRPDLVISMEMFERDVQEVLDRYLRGAISEEVFLARSRPWPNYQQAYRPVIEFAKANRLEVIAANAPRELAAKAARSGAASVVGCPLVARSTTAPGDAYWRRFRKAMAGHQHGHGGDPLVTKRFYEAQCLKDDTMAESIADRLTELHRQGRRPLVVHFCGRFHSDHGLGTVSRLRSRMPGLKIEVR